MLRTDTREKPLQTHECECTLNEILPVTFIIVCRKKIALRNCFFSLDRHKKISIKSGATLEWLAIFETTTHEKVYDHINALDG